jgi:hypothetical protein
MTTNPDAVRRFLHAYAAEPVGVTPVQPAVHDDEDHKPTIDRTIEVKPEEKWEPKPVPEWIGPDDDLPRRFIDGSHTDQPVLCVKAPQGWPIPLLLGEVGAVALRAVGRRFEREFATVERVLSFIPDPFPWAEVEAFAAGLLNKPEFQLRVLPAKFPDEVHSPFDYEVMRKQARARIHLEMRTLERLALAADRSVPTLVDGPLNRVTGAPNPASPLVVGVAKSHAANYLHDQGWRTLLSLKPGQRTPAFRYEGVRGEHGGMPVASWYLKLAGGPRLAPNWGYVRVEIPWGQFENRGSDFGLIDRLSRWLIDARCRTDSYARMPVSLDPIVRAEDSLKPLFTAAPVLVNRLYRTVGLFRGNES